MTTRNPLVRISGKIVDLPAGDALGGAAQGPVGMTWQGAWNSGTSYVVDDAVENDGSAYIATAANTNQEPPNASYWDLLASKGDQGIQGVKGDQGDPGSGGAVVLLEQHTATSGDATMDFTTAISSTYDEYELRIIGFQPATNSVQLTLRVMTGSPAAADSGSNYRWANNRTSDAAANTATGSTGGTSFDITGGSAVNTSTKVYQGIVRFSLPQNTSVHKPFLWDCVWSGASNAVVRSEGGGVYQATTALTGIRLLFSSGNIAAGTARLYGITKV